MMPLRSRVFAVIAACLGAAAAAPGAAASATELLYVGNNHAGTVSVIEVPGFRVIDTIDAVPDIPAPRAPGATWVDDVVASPDGRVLYVSRASARDVAAFDVRSHRLLWKVPARGAADHFALSPDGKRLFVSVYSENEVMVVDTAARRETARLASCAGPHGMRFSADGSKAYNGCMVGDELAVIDTGTLEIVQRIAFPEGVRPFDLDASGRRLFVQLTRLHGFQELEMPAGRLAKTVHLPVPPGVAAQQAFPHTAHHGLALTPDGAHLCVAATVADYAAILTVPALDLVATIPTAREPSWVIPSLDGRYCYVSARKGDSVSVISVAERREVARIPVGAYPQRMWAVRAPAH